MIPLIAVLVTLSLVWSLGQVLAGGRSKSGPGSGDEPFGSL